MAALDRASPHPFGSVRLLAFVGFGVGLGSFASVMPRMRVVAVCRVGVVGGFFVIAGLVVLGGFLMVTSGVLVMLSSLMVVLCGFRRHDAILSFRNEFHPNRTSILQPVLQEVVGWLNLR